MIKNTLTTMVSLVIVCIFSACKEISSEDVVFRPGHILITSKDFLIPRELKSKIEQEYLKFIRAENIKIIASDEDLLAQIPRGFLDIQISFQSSVEGVLAANTKFNLPRGGGEIDLKNYVKGTKGSFFMNIGALGLDRSPSQKKQNTRSSI